MQPHLIRSRELALVGLETMTTADSLLADVETLNRKADALGLLGSIAHAPDKAVYFQVLWNWQADGPFPLMVALAVEDTADQPAETVTRRFPASDYAVFDMQGRMPNLTEDWDAIGAWYPRDLGPFSVAVRRYDERAGTGQIWVPLTPGLAPT